MYYLDVELEGIADILFNRFSPGARKQWETGSTGQKPTAKQAQEAAEGRAYLDHTGLYLPPWTAKKILLEGAFDGKLKINKKPLHRWLGAVAFVQGTPRFLDQKGKPVKTWDYVHEVMGRQPPGPKGKPALILRPALRAGWRLTFQVAILDDVISEKAVHEAYSQAGLYVGAGGWRPEFGRFLVKSC